MKFIKSYKIFESQEKLKIKKYKNLYDSGYDVSYSIFLDNDEIGSCEIETFFKQSDFDEKKEFFTFRNPFNYENPVKKSYYDKYPYYIKLNGFEIEDDYKGKGFGKKSFSMILKNIENDFPKNEGIYLDVFKENKSAISIYLNSGFKIINEYKFYDGEEVLKMKK